MWILVVPLSLVLGVWIGRRSRALSQTQAQAETRGPRRTQGEETAAHGTGATPEFGHDPATFGRVAHELLSPLGALSSALEVQERSLALRGNASGPGEEASVRALHTARAALTHIGEIAARLRTAGRIRPEQRAATEADELVDAALLLVGHQLRGLPVDRDGSAGLAVQVVPGEIVRVLMNLLVNAARAVAGAGRIRITTRRDGSSVLFVVSDTGPGVDRADGERIFLEGHSRWPDGAEGDGDGYGLALGRRTARRHGGDLVLGESELGGASFQLRLPGAGDPPQGKRAAQGPEDTERRE